MKRREFIKQAFQRTAVISSTAISAKRILGSNDRVIIGLIGCGGRGMDVAANMRKVPGAEYGAVCDVFETNANAAKAWAGSTARAFKDFRKLLEQKDIDAVHIATPDHWHAIPTLLACRRLDHRFRDASLRHCAPGDGRRCSENSRRLGRPVLSKGWRRDARCVAGHLRIPGFHHEL